MTFSKFSLLFFLASLFACQEELPQMVGEASTKATEDTLFVAEELLLLNQQQGLVYYEGKPFTGVAVESAASGGVVAKIQYQEGKKHGVEQKWFADGSPSYYSEYHEGKKHGTTKTWWKNGHPRSVGRFADGIGEGIQEQWYQSGSLFKKRQLVNGKEQGLQQSWRENGKLYNNYEAKDGRIYGLKRGNLCYELEEEIVQY
jgi:antitoxin component YwqK of YwqJK toxin-antitoxin module